MEKYRQIVHCAHEAFQRRLNRIEVELAEAQHALENLDLRILSHDRKTAIIMAQHARLGENSPLHGLPEDLLRVIASGGSLL